MKHTWAHIVTPVNSCVPTVVRCSSAAAPTIPTYECTQASGRINVGSVTNRSENNRQRISTSLCTWAINRTAARCVRKLSHSLPASTFTWKSTTHASSKASGRIIVVTCRWRKACREHYHPKWPCSVIRQQTRTNPISNVVPNHVCQMLIARQLQLRMDQLEKESHRLIWA